MILNKIIKLIPLLYIIRLLSCTPETDKLSKVDEYGPVKTGDSVPLFAGITKNGYQVGPGIPKGKFHVYIINQDLPALALDQEIDNIEFILEKGGHVIGGCDGKFAKMFGVHVLSGPGYKLSESLIIISNQNGKITAIYKNAKTTDLKSILKDSGY